MRFQDAKSLRQSIEERARRYAQGDPQKNLWFRRSVAFERFIARIALVAPENFYLKGGLALHYRFGDAMRYTADIDYGAASDEQMHAVLAAAVASKIDDFFEMETLSGPLTMPAVDRKNRVYSWTIDTTINGKSFTRFGIDIGVGDAIDPNELEFVSTRGILQYAGISAAKIRTIPLVRHVAEKLHAYVQEYPQGINTRIKDIVDLALLGQMNLEIDHHKMATVIMQVFEERGLALIPEVLPLPPQEWESRYLGFVREQVPPTLKDAYTQAAKLLNPVLEIVHTCKRQ